MGVGETVRDALGHPDDAVRAADLWADPHRLRAMLERMRERLWPAAQAAVARCDHPGTAPSLAAEELRIFADAEVLDRWLDFIAPLQSHPAMLADAAGPTLSRDDTVVLEGAQGVLLDEHWGFHPHTTWSPCTTDNALAWLREWEFTGPVHRMPSATPDLDHLEEPHNSDEGWQGRFLKGWPDPLLWNYALRATGGVDSLAVTHLDRLATAPTWRVVTGYRGLREGTLDASGAIRPRDPNDLRDRERLTADLLRAQADFTDLPGHSRLGPADRFIEWASDALEVPVSIASHGPTARHKFVLQPGLDGDDARRNSSVAPQ